MMKNLQKFRHWQTSESALRFMNGLTLVCLVVWIFMLWFIDIFSYHHLQSCTYIDQCTFIRAEFSPVTPNKFIWAYQNRKIVLDLGSILYWVVRKFTKAAMNVKWSSVDKKNRDLLVNCWHICSPYHVFKQTMSLMS